MGRKEPRRKGSKHRVQSSSGSNHSTPHQGKELPFVSHGEPPGSGQGKGGAGSADVTEDREPGEPIAQEEGEAYHTRRKGPHAQMEGREKRLTTRAEASTLANPEEFRFEEDTGRSSRQDSHKHPIIGLSAQPGQVGSETRGRGDQVAGKTKVWKNLKKCFKRDSQAKATTVEQVLQKKEPTHEPGPETIADRNTGRATLEPPAAQGEQAATTTHPTRGRSFHGPARANTPEGSKEME